MVVGHEPEEPSVHLLLAAGSKYLLCDEKETDGFGLSASKSFLAISVVNRSLCGSSNRCKLERLDSRYRAVLDYSRCDPGNSNCHR